MDETEQDLIEILKRDFKDDPQDGHVYEMLPKWAQYKARCIEPLQRNVFCSPSVTAKRCHFPAISEIEDLLRHGGDLKPYLSKKIQLEPDESNPDWLFLDWRIHHFHLGNLSENMDSVSRTRQVLFVYIYEHEAVLLDVRDHGKSNPLIWVDTDLLRLLRDVRPDLLSRLEAKGVTGVNRSWSQEERASLRPKGANEILEVDGKFYCGLGGFISTAGTGVYFGRLTDQLCVSIKELVETVHSAKLARPMRIGVKHIPAHLVVYDKDLDLEFFRSCMIY
jgi:hypothetical protein